jgi:hypothetical protein
MSSETNSQAELVDSWSRAGKRRRWLRENEARLREAAAKSGWRSVADWLETAGWSEFWNTGRPLTGEALAREFALIAHADRRTARRRGDIPAASNLGGPGRPTPQRLIDAIAAAVIPPIAAKIDEIAGSARAPAAPPPAAVPNSAPAAADQEFKRTLDALRPSPPPSPMSAGARLRARLAAQAAGEITPPPRATKQLILDPSLQTRAASGVDPDFVIPTKTEEK